MHSEKQQTQRDSAVPAVLGAQLYHSGCCAATMELVGQTPAPCTTTLSSKRGDQHAESSRPSSSLFLWGDYDSIGNSSIVCCSTEPKPGRCSQRRVEEGENAAATAEARHTEAGPAALRSTLRPIERHRAVHSSGRHEN